MDTHIQRALNDKFYDKRKIGALEYVSPSPACLPKVAGHFFARRPHPILQLHGTYSLSLLPPILPFRMSHLAQACYRIP
jgi:hypothetical protein